MTRRSLPFVLLAVCTAGVAVAQESGIGPAPVARPLEGQAALEPIVPPAAIGPAGQAAPLEGFENLPTEEELRAEELRQREASRPPPLKPRAVPQRVEVLAPGRMLILPRETPVQGGTVSGQMFSDDTETLQPLPPPLMTLEPLIGQMNMQAEAMERVVADMEARMDAMEASPTQVVAPPPSPTEVVSEKPKPLPKALTLPYVADVAGLGPSNGKKLSAWLEKIGEGRKVKIRLTAHVLEPTADGLGEDPAKLGERRAAAVKAAIAKSGVALAGPVAVVVLRLKAGETSGQRIVAKVSQ